MRIAVLLSASIHPVSGRPSLSRTEAQAIALGMAIGGDVVAFHVGHDSTSVKEAFGYGIAKLVHIPAPPRADPVPALVDELRRFEPDLILTGPRSVGGDETGLVPYCLAEALGVSIVADAVDITAEAGEFSVLTALPKGVRLVTREPSPLIATVHPATPYARGYAYAAERRGQIETRPATSFHAEIERPTERPMRKRAKLRANASTGGSAADRLKAATEAATTGGGEVIVEPDPETAARAILSHLRRIGVLSSSDTC